MASKFVGFVQRRKVISIVITIVIVLSSWWAITTFMPHPLGEKLEYLGKKDYGCWIGFCDSKPASTYYYGTDLEPSEMQTVFSAQYSPLDNLAFKNARFTSSDGEFIFTYETTRSFSTSKKYVISIVNSQYTIAKEHLKK